MIKKSGPVCNSTSIHRSTDYLQGGHNCAWTLQLIDTCSNGEPNGNTGYKFRLFGRVIVLCAALYWRLVVRASDSKPEVLDSMPDVTKHTPSTYGVVEKLGHHCSSIKRQMKSRTRKSVVVLNETKQRTVAHYIESVTHHSVSKRTIRRRLQQSGLSARRSLLGLPLTHIHRRLRRQWCDERRMWAAEWNEVIFTVESRICLQHHDGRIRVWRHRGERMLNSCVMHRHTGPVPGIMVWGGIGYHSRNPLVRIAGTLNSQRYISEVLEPVEFLTFRAWPQPYFKWIMHDDTWTALSKCSSSITRLNCFPGRFALRIFH
ncbi:transposable element Tcb1 transposase [Trichonephila clavipes]|nr:transposable element Tcb1 transposase [Trichonephila clavipes]